MYPRNISMDLVSEAATAHTLGASAVCVPQGEHHLGCAGSLTRCCLEELAISK